MNRRHFLETTALVSLGLSLPFSLRAQSLRPSTPVRIRGHVRSGARGLSRVGVTDGRQVVSTDKKGNFELIADAAQPFVYLTLPASYQIPVTSQGIAQHFRPIQPNGRGEMQVNFTLEALPEQEHHQFLVLADPQTANAEDMTRLHAESVKDIQALRAQLPDTPMFGVSNGDIMWDHLKLYPDYIRAVSDMGIPFYQVVGNHDLDMQSPTQVGATNTFSHHFGPSHYAFNHGAVHYVVLNDVFWYGEGYIGYLDERQMQWLKQDLALIEPGRTVVVFMHIPAYSTLPERQGEGGPSIRASLANRQYLYEVLAPYNAHIMTGHTHELEHVFEGGAHEHVCGALCGAWWTGDIMRDGGPNGYMVFNVRGEELRWQYKATGQPLEHQLRVYPAGSDPKAPAEIIANVWNWDPSWQVYWIEDGIRKGQMARRTGTDPLSEQQHRGADKPSIRGWVEPAPTHHMFYAPASPNAESIRVEAIDPWGRTYTATV